MKKVILSLLIFLSGVGATMNLIALGYGNPNYEGSWLNLIASCLLGIFFSYSYNKKEA